MSTINGISFQDPRNINLKGGSVNLGVIRWDQNSGTGWTFNPIDSSAYGLYINSSGQLVFSSLGSTTVLGSGGGSGTPSWETLFAADHTFTITPDFTFEIAGNRSTATNVLTLSNAAGGSGAVLAFSNLGSGNDVTGTSSTWGVTAAGVATFAGVSISGTSSAIVSTGAAVWTLKDNDSTALSIGSSGATTSLVFDTTNSAEKITATVRGFTIIGNSNTVNTLLLTNNTATTFGSGGASAGVVVVRSTSLTTGTLVRLQLTEGTLNGGYYLDAFDATGATTVFSVGEDGATVIAGAGGSDMFTVTAGDVVVSDGSITLTDADDAASFTVTNNTAATASAIVIAGSGTFTGTTTTSFMTITPSGLTSGTAVYLPVAAMTSGKALHVVAATANFTTNGALAYLDSTAAVAGNHLVAVTTGAYTGTGMILVSAGAATTGVLVSVASTTGLTSGSLIRATSSTAGAIATNGAISFRATGAFTSTSNVGFVDVLASATTAGTVVRIASSAAAQTATELLRVHASGFTTGYTGNVVNIISTSTTGASNALLVTTDASTAGTGIKVVANSLTTGTGLLVSSSGTITSSGEGLVNIVGTGITTGDALKIDLTEATLNGGNYINCYDDTGTASVFKVAEDGAITTGTGTINFGGAFILSGTETIAAGGTSTALSLTKVVHYVDADAGGDTFTLADGTAGQVMTILMKSSTGTATITPTNLAGGTSVTFNAAGDSVVLQFMDTDWYIIGGNSYAVV